MAKELDEITILVLGSVFLIIAMSTIIIIMLYRYKKKQMANRQKLAEIEASYEKNLLKTQLEIQEQTFLHISREIHDNISLSLTLAKLHLNTLDQTESLQRQVKVYTAIELLTKSIGELNDISKSLNADIIIQHGLLKAVEEEVNRLKLLGLFDLDFDVTGTPVYMDNQKELIIFRIIQESFNNILKHADTMVAQLTLNYETDHLHITVADRGDGFDTTLPGETTGAGLKNMATRVQILKGTMQVQSRPGNGTTLLFTIPYN